MSALLHLFGCLIVILFYLPSSAATLIQPEGFFPFCRPHLICQHEPDGGEMASASGMTDPPGSDPSTPPPSCARARARRAAPGAPEVCL